MGTKIAWTNETWNPVVGCTKVSAGCQNCYAERMAARLATMGHQKYYSVVNWVGGSRPANSPVFYCQKARGWNGKVYCDENELRRPLHWRNPRMIFCPSMGDLFHPAVPFEFVSKVMAVIALCRQHTFQVLTKHPDRMAEYFSKYSAGKAKIGDSLRKIGQEGLVQRLMLAKAMTISDDGKPPYKPPDNLWLGTTVENNKELWRVEHLLNTPAAVRFLSLEPLLEDIDFGRWIHHDSCGCLDRYDIEHCPHCNDTGAVAEFDWVIVGAESKGAYPGRECPLEWIEHIVEQCREAGVACFVKQVHVNGKLVKNFDELPEQVRLRQMPRVSANGKNDTEKDLCRIDETERR